MKPPPIPENEAARLAELHGLHVLDTPAEERFDRIARIAKRALGTRIALVSLVDTDRQWIKAALGVAVPEVPRAVSFCGHAILGDQALVVPDARVDERFHDNPAVTGSLGVRLYAGQSIRGPTGQRIGTLCVIDSEPRQMQPEELALLKDLAILVENELRLDLLALSERQLRQTLSAAERRAAVDSLTRMWNRESIFRLLDLEMDRSQRAGEALGIAMIDVDHFKRINDSHGHAVGDEALTGIAARIRSALRDRDMVGRYGGEEFLAVFGAEGPGMPSAVAERVREQVAQTPILCSCGELAVTVSIGVCSTAVRPGVTRDELVTLSDRALYAAKRGGRNRVEACGP
ncbi:MAG TPA: sensor domain-containing diguanylate cyclase [Anaeromyxobacteraceae bacterium]|nr:sensor domain-containing diguanylate cyclase [Anaeromyxobacteraceae bacterium]